MNRPLELLNHLRQDRSPFVVLRGSPGPQWQDADLHTEAYDQAPVRYALCGLVDRSAPEQRARILYQLLAASRNGFSTEAREMLDRVVRALLKSLVSERALKVFVALRRARANHKHTQRAILRYLVNHPQLELLAVQRRPTLVDALEHALGRNVARACAKNLQSNGISDAYARRSLLRHAREPKRLAEVIGYLYGHSKELAIPEGQMLPVEHSQDAEAERPRTITATNRGDIAATLVHMYRGGSNQELQQALERYVREVAEDLPRFNGKIALILDASESTAGYGERQFCCISQSQALRLVLKQCCSDLEVLQVGGGEELAHPEGETDLAGALIDALELEPDVIAIVSDGYENVYEGDLARVVATLPPMGIETPVVFCHSKFTDRDDLSMRRPAPQLPELGFWHQDDFRELLWTLFATSRSPKSEQFLDAELQSRLLATEKECVV